MKRVSETGEVLHKQLLIKILIPQSDRFHRSVIKAEAGTGMNKQMITDYLAAASLEVQEAFPTHQFRMVQVGEAEFNFVPTGIRIANAS
jgi:hypothetical protein